jgi:thioesterase domain-containing protein
VGTSSIHFLHPVRECIRAVCLEPGADELAAFLQRLRDKGKSRIALRVRVEEKGTLAAEFEGVFVAFTARAP